MELPNTIFYFYKLSFIISDQYEMILIIFYQSGVVQIGKKQNCIHLTVNLSQNVIDPLMSVKLQSKKFF